ncbi:hypothetical protein BU16DRAFT_554015 [Lophium mytilinum]|uniref:MIF4G domain-containing protein n=1 Tax=Lophium mytilinum TaxID=390894 RepID=A0A6A6RAX7_9PEZI|nr:hypothetical protein BU16DRAFT_554015 [Lophium mytilinum]
MAHPPPNLLFPVHNLSSLPTHTHSGTSTSTTSTIIIITKATASRHHPDHHHQVSAASTAIMSTFGATPSANTAATAPTHSIKEQVKALVDAMPALTPSTLDAHAAPLAGLINARSPAEPDAYTLRVALMVVYHRAWTAPTWSVSGAALLNRLGTLVAANTTDEATKNTRGRPLRGVALIRRLLFGQLLSDFEKKETRSTGCVALLGELYKLPPTAPLNVLGMTVFAAAKTIINGEREEDGGDIEVLLMFLTDIKEKLAGETGGWGEEGGAGGEEWMAELGQDLGRLAVDERVPEFVQFEVADMWETWGY